jgi:tryptophan synthase beta subunit
LPGKFAGIWEFQRHEVPPKMDKNQLIIVNLSGCGDEDGQQVAAKVGLQMPE